MSQANVAIVEDASRALTRGDVDAVLGLTTNDVDLRPPAHWLDGIVYRGHAGVRTWMERTAESWREVEVSPREVATVGEHVVTALDVRLIGHESGAPVNERAGMTAIFATRGSSHYRGFHVYTLREGKIAAIIAYPSEREALEAVELRESVLSRENVEVVRQHIEAYAAGDAERALRVVHPEVEVDTTRMGIEGDMFYGHAGLAEAVRRFRGAFYDYRFEVRGLVEIDDSVVGLVRDAGRGKTSGIEADRSFALVYLFRAGKIARITEYPHDTEALEAVGLRDG